MCWKPNGNFCFIAILCRRYWITTHRTTQEKTVWKARCFRCRAPLYPESEFLLIELVYLFWTIGCFEGCYCLRTTKVLIRFEYSWRLDIVVRGHKGLGVWPMKTVSIQLSMQWRGYRIIREISYEIVAHYLLLMNSQIYPLITIKIIANQRCLTCLYRSFWPNDSIYRSKWLNICLYLL